MNNTIRIIEANIKFLKDQKDSTLRGQKVFKKRYVNDEPSINKFITGNKFFVNKLEEIDELIIHNEMLLAALTLFNEDITNKEEGK